ncbi:hypothetical protein Cgig2_023646 [Carnegiea gigantea]|uniref:Uncharacterized protein n=1 Tax=Carnegiea gigantea TaxID=171969 RepID=A0A9Q1Q501_9CARY|nr:hypothetical protein Cgig2_023646 [Carnegiea gigantea]
MSFHSKRTRAEAHRNETTWGTNAEHTIVEENVQTNPIRGRSQAQCTAASNIPLSSQNQRLPNSSNETQRQSRCLEDDEEEDDDLQLLRRVGKAWRNHRYLLKKQYKVPGKTKQDVKDKQLSNQGREARASQDHYHTTGNKSFAMKRDELDTAESSIAERMTDGASAKDIEDEIRKRGCVSRDNSNEEVVMLRAEVVGLKSQLTAQAEEMKEMKGMHQQMQNEMHDQFLRLTSLLVNKFGGPNVGITSTPSGSKERENDTRNNIQVIHLNCLSYCCV